VDYCLKSLPVENLPPGYEFIADCASPADCHDAIFRDDLMRSFTPWRPISGANWTVPGGERTMPLLLPSGPFHGSLRCMAEADGVQGSDCTLNAEDVDVLGAHLDRMLAARVPGERHAFSLAVATIGDNQPTDSATKAGLELVALHLQDQVRAGHIEFVTAAELVARYADR
jgi:hypothetical protein